MQIRVDGHVVEMDAWHYTIIRLSEHSLEAGTLTTRTIYDMERLEEDKGEKKRQFGDTPIKDQKKKKRKSE